jgi:predicted nucleic acid-binding Zn ribbon protein
MTPWRELDADDSPRPVGASLDRIAQRLGAPKASALAAVFDRWNEVVGDAVAAHAKPRSLRKGSLVVAVDDAAWATELRSIADRIVARCAEVAGVDVVTNIDVRVAR